MERRVVLVVGLAVLFLGILQVAVQARTTLVSASQIHVTGASHFSCDQIAEKLSTSLRNQQALSPKSPVEDVREFFEKQLLANYRSAGFLEVSIQTQVDHVANEYHIEIKEGAQYLVGDVRVTGLPESDLDVFLTELIQPGTPIATTIDRFEWHGGKWIPVRVDKEGEVVEPKPSSLLAGEPVRVLDPRYPAITENVARALVAIGRLTAQLKFEMTKERGDRISFDLHISELALPLLGKYLQIVGCKKNTQADMLKYLAIDPEEILTDRRFEELRLRLWLSGRFVKIRGRAAPGRPPGSTPTACFELEEYENAPAILEPLSEAEQAMLRFHEWLSRLPESDETLRMESRSATMAMTCQGSFGQGFLLSLANRHLLATPGRIVYCAADRQEKLTIPLERMTLAPIVSLDFPDEPEEADPRAAFDFDFPSELSAANSSVPAVSLRVRADPCACLDMLHAPDTQYSIDDGVLTIVSPQAEMKIETRTGRLLERATTTEGGGKRLAISATSDDFEVVCRNMEKVWEPYPDLFLPAAPISSMFRFVAADPEISRVLLEAVTKRRKRPLDERQAAVFLKLLNGAVLPTADEVYAQWREGRQGDHPNFFAYGERELYSDLSAETAPSAKGAITIALLGLFPSGTWPHHYIGATGFASARSQNLYRYHVEPLLNSPTKSPTRDMLVAEWFKRTHPETANHLAWRGLGNLTDEAFFDDRAVLLDEGHIFGRFVLHVAETLQDLTDREAEALMDACFGGPEPGFAAALQHLRLQRDRPAREVLPDAIEIAWETAWREATKARLSEIVKTTAGQAKPGVFQWEFAQDDEETEKSDSSRPQIDAQAPFSQRAQTASKPLWETTPQAQPESDTPQTGSRFELQGPFSK